MEIEQSISVVGGGTKKKKLQHLIKTSGIKQKMNLFVFANTL
jgi:hypothetical protein